MAIFQLFFLGNISQENVFYDSLEQKKPYLGYNNKKFKKSKIDIFPNPWFCQKWPFFQLFFFLGNISQENVFYDSLEQKKPYVGYNNKKFKTSKIDIFPNPWFWSKNGHFSNFFF